MGKALFSPFSAALATLTFALVATFIPKNPAVAEQNDPKRYAVVSCMFCVGCCVCHMGVGRRVIMRAETIVTNIVSVVYSLFRKAFAPSFIAAAISRILGVPVSCLLT